MHRTAVKKVVRENVLDANDTLARANRDLFDRAGTYTINMMSSPGAGKTALLERTLERLRGQLRLGVLEGDVQTTLDADRLARFHIPLVQVNTDPGFGGECHLDANMVRSGLGELPLEDIDVLIIENVGNLVCPAEFRVGEDVRVMVYSITEGEEKPLSTRSCSARPTWYWSTKWICWNTWTSIWSSSSGTSMRSTRASGPSLPAHGPVGASMSGATGSGSASKMSETWVVSMFTIGRATAILPPLPGGGNR